jgi:hypothetical protein
MTISHQLFTRDTRFATVDLPDSDFTTRERTNPITLAVTSTPNTTRRTLWVTGEEKFMEEIRMTNDESVMGYGLWVMSYAM